MRRRSARQIVGDEGPIRVDDEGVLRIEEHAAPALAERYGTPLFVTSEAQIRANVRRLRAAFEERWPRVTLLYATKANANLAVRRILVGEGVGGDCFGLGELTVSLRAGVAPERLVLNGGNKQPPELRAAIEAGVTINVDDPTELDAVGRLARELGRPASICLRVLPFSYADPGSLEPDLAAIAADTSHDKWGMDRRRSSRDARALASDRLRLRGLHLHVSRLRPTPEAFELAAELIADCIAELRDRFGWEPELLDFGGGFPHERDPESGEASSSHAVGTPEEYAEAVTSTLRAALAERSLAEPHLLLEPGRRLVSNATVLLTRVGVVKRLPSGSTTWVNVDASTNHSPRVPLQGYYYEIVHATKGDEEGDGRGQRRRADLHGRPPGRAAHCRRSSRATCSRCSTSAATRRCSRTQFNMVPRPANVLVAAASAEVIRRRETLGDILATQSCRPGSPESFSRRRRACALARERLALPPAPALAHRHPGEARHQVELRRPDVAERRREDLDLVAGDPVVMRDEALSRDVVLIEPEVRRRDVEELEPLARWEVPQPRYDHLDDEAAARLEMGGDVLEARDLLVLRRQVHDRVGDEVRDRERSLDRGRSEVADRDADLLRSRLRLQPRDHGFRQIDPVHPHAALCQRQCDPARADTELECVAVPGKLQQERNDGIDHAAVSLVRVSLVEPRRDGLAEVVLGHRSHSAKPRLRGLLTIAL